MGNTSDIEILTRALKVHPHIHGEYVAIGRRSVLVFGSPPHTWGILIRVGEKAELARFTPTYMGNTVV